MAVAESGHRTLPHTADLRIEAWAPTRSGCIEQAVLGTVASFLDTSSARPKRSHRRCFTEQRDDDLLAAVIDEVIFRLDTESEAPVGLDIDESTGSVEVRFSMADATDLPQLGAVPKAVSFNDLRLSHGKSGWRCQVTLDV